eukprot:COSAG02_NODE_6313_length_3659_cov_122.161798_4_plen_197_part_00
MGFKQRNHSPSHFYGSQSHQGDGSLMSYGRQARLTSPPSRSTARYPEPPTPPPSQCSGMVCNGAVMYAVAAAARRCDGVGSRPQPRVLPAPTAGAAAPAPRPPTAQPASHTRPYTVQCLLASRITTVLLSGKSPWTTIVFPSHFHSHFPVDLYGVLTVVCRILILQSLYILQPQYNTVHVLHTIPYYYVHVPYCIN